VIFPNLFNLLPKFRLFQPASPLPTISRAFKTYLLSNLIMTALELFLHLLIIEKLLSRSYYFCF